MSIISYGIRANNFILVGGRRIGKTTILRKLENRLSESDICTIYQDCSIVSNYDEFIRSLNSTANKKGVGCKKIPTQLEDILSAMSTKNKHPVLLIDEADKLLKIDTKDKSKILNNLRASSNGGFCHVVLSGEQSLLKELGNANSTLFHFGEKILIGGLARDEVKILVTKPMKSLNIELVEEQSILDYIWAMTAGHPNIVQLICHRIISTQYRRIDIGIVQLAASDPEFIKRDYLNILWEKADPLEKVCSLIMAMDENVSAYTALALQSELKKRGLDVSIKKIETAITNLIELRNIIKSTEEGYQFNIIAFPSIIRNAAWSQDFIQGNIEQYLDEERGKSL